MKKTLVAVAVLAASGASIAQVTVSGAYAYGFRTTHTASTATVAGSDSSGFGVDTSMLKFSASEDLGGGNKVSAYMQIDGLNRADGAKGGDSNITFATASFGTFILGLEESADFMTRSTGNAGGVDFNGKLYAAKAGGATDDFWWQYPVTKELTFAYDLSEAGLEGFGAGSAGAATVTKQRQSQYRLNYASGPIKATVRYAMYDAKTAASTTSAEADNRLRLAGTYDFGVAKIGAAYNNLTYSANTAGTGQRTDTAVSVGVPLGALVLGANYGERKWDTVPGKANGTINGWGLSADYSLSKRTSINTYYTSYNKSVAETEKNNEFWLVLGHTF